MMPDELPAPIGMLLNRHFLTFRPIVEEEGEITCFVETNRRDGLVTRHIGVVRFPDHIFNDLRDAIHDQNKAKAKTPEPSETKSPAEATAIRSVYQAFGGFERWEMQTVGSEGWIPLPGVANEGTIRKAP